MADFPSAFKIGNDDEASTSISNGAFDQHHKFTMQHDVGGNFKTEND